MKIKAVLGILASGRGIEVSHIFILEFFQTSPPYLLPHHKRAFGLFFLRRIYIRDKRREKERPELTKDRKAKWTLEFFTRKF